MRLFLTLLFAALLWPSASHAYHGEIPLKPCVRAVEAGDTVEMVAATAAKFDCTTPQTQFGPGDYWVRLDTRHTSGKMTDPLKLRMASLWLDSQEIHVFYADGTRSALLVPADRTSDFITLGARLEFPLAQNGQAVEQIIVKVGNAANIRGIMLSPQLLATHESARDQRNLAALYGAFAGLCLALLVYNIALWRGMRSPFQLAYAAMVISLLAYAFTSSGAAALIFPDLENQQRLRFNYVMLASAAATALIFLRHFLEKHCFPPWLVRMFWIQAASLVTAGAAFALLAPQKINILDQIYFFSFVPLPAFFILALYFGWRSKSRYTGYLLLAWTAPVVVSTARSLHGIGLIPHSFALDNASLSAMAIEAMISSMAIGQRVRQIARERDGAQHSAALARNLADRDSLTGLLNRRAFVRLLLEEPREWQLVLVDIDHFKRVNDTLGHVDGDEVLVKVARTLESGCGTGALVARLGGEEFAIATAIGASLAERVDPAALVQAIRQAEMPSGYRVTVSIGVADRAICEEQDWVVLYRAADMALYRAKAEGRDRHVDYSATRIAA